MESRKNFRPGPYSLRRDKDGVDDVWQIYAAGEDRPFVSIPFWGDDVGWSEGAAATARLLSAAPELVRILELTDSCLELIAGSKYHTSTVRAEIQTVLRFILEPDYGRENESIHGHHPEWGRCRHCHGSDGYLNIGQAHWFYCKAHWVKWFAGENIFSTWQSETDADWKKNEAFLRDFKLNQNE